jgi:hypothetical protein
MHTTQQETAVIGIFPDRRQALHFVEELKRDGFTDDQIGVATRGAEPAETQAEGGAITGALAGGTLGGVLGATAAGAIPGFGPVIAAGILASTVGGAAAGATAGGLVGALIGLGIPEDEAHQYDHEFQAGRTLVVVQGEGRLGDAISILRRCQNGQ